MRPKTTVTLLSALAHETRLAICSALAGSEGGLLSSELAERAKISRTLLSSHVKILEHAGLITASRSGRNVRWSLREVAVRTLTEQLSGLLAG